VHFALLEKIQQGIRCVFREWLAARFISALGTLKFVFDGTRLRPEETPAEVNPLSLLLISDMLIAARV
jgi:hypothetical protein